MTRPGAAGLASCLTAAAGFLLIPGMVRGGADPAEVLAAQWDEYRAVTPKTIIELQPFRRTTTMEVDEGDGREMTATLIEVNPQINAWFVLTLRRSGEQAANSYHIQNPRPLTQRLALDQSDPKGIRISGEGRPVECPLWAAGQPRVLDEARRSSLPDAPICGDRLYLRNAVAGTYTNLERITNLLRDHVWGGDKIVSFVKQQFFKDAFIERDALGNTAPGSQSISPQAGAPRPAAVDEGYAASAVRPEHLAIDVGPESSSMQLGRWYPVRDGAGIWVSVMQPQAVDAAMLRSHKESVSPLDSIEAGALDYLVAMDLSELDLGFELGTDHPRVGWSARALPAMRDPALPGPDGIGVKAPLVTNGIVSPELVARVAATFAGGFKREHGAFHYGPLAAQNAGSHYGFIEQGAIFSKLQPGLATLTVSDVGSVEMKTWTERDNDGLDHIKHARQNGVPLIEVDAASGVSRPGLWVNRWGPGNWSGSSDEQLRTLRAGVCLQENGPLRYLIYGYFSTATPSAMARVFQAYGCRYAMHLDMNAPEHTYFALYTPRNGQMVVQHLIDSMAAVDRKGGAQLAPRFLSFPDDRDFFYLTRKE